MNKSLDRDSVESRWRTNERELNRIDAMPATASSTGSVRTSYSTSRTRSSSGSDFDRPADAESRRWSGMA
jgi:hypothetical protein